MSSLLPEMDGIARFLGPQPANPSDLQTEFSKLRESGGFWD